MSSGALQPGRRDPAGFAQVRRVQCRGLGEDQRREVERLISEPIPLIHHPSFVQAEAEACYWGTSSAAATARTDPWCNAATPDSEQIHDTAPTTLTAQQEQASFLRLNYARWRMRQIVTEMQGNRLKRRVAEELLTWARRADALRAALVRANMPLVLAMAKRTRLGNIDFAELISEGNMALLRSIDKFDCARGYKFSTYACRAIIKSFSRVAMRASRYRGRFPTEFDPSLEKSDFLDLCRAREESDCVDELRTIMSRNLAELNEVEQTVIRARFALDVPTDGPTPPAPKTLEEVGQLIGVTKERVRQIQNRALAKLKARLEESILAA
ncbi:MAG: sigma-70 family RNA polymerase sigma factor [Phycisphaerae bacterium]|nr:sigma-70 family RNA polymerase sigma factor [Phycisphaerae bacterium]